MQRWYLGVAAAVLAIILIVYFLSKKKIPEPVVKAPDGSTISLGSVPNPIPIALQMYSFYGDGSLELRGIPSGPAAAATVANPASLVGHTLTINIQGLGAATSKVMEVLPASKLGPGQVGIVAEPGAYTTMPNFGLKMAAVGDVATVS
jgi:hypothetical protein